MSLGKSFHVSFVNARIAATVSKSTCFDFLQNFTLSMLDHAKAETGAQCVIYI